MRLFKYSLLDCLLTCLGVLLSLVDIVMDILAARSFYQEKAYARLGILLLFLLGSSLLVHAFSWLWYSYDNFKRETKVERCLSENLLKVLHVLQLGIYLRQGGILEVSIINCCSKNHDPEGVAVYLSHDLSMLRIIEMVSESAPQLVLMLTVILQQGQSDPVTVAKALFSAIAIALCMTTYHRALRSFLPDKEKPHVTSSIIYFLWNLFLVSSRLTAIALFASVHPCFIFTHFICSWMVLFFFAWRSNTKFMESPCGEWLYRGTVGLIWYFDWFNVVEGRTRYRTLLYHGYILVDMSVLCGVWYWKMSTDPPHFVIPHAIIVAVCVVVVYIVGLLIKLLYYKCFHPNHSKEELKVDSTEELQVGNAPSEARFDVVDFRFLRYSSPTPPARPARPARPDHPDHPARPASPDHPDHPARPSQCNKRMRNLAENFYT